MPRGATQWVVLPLRRMALLVGVGVPEARYQNESNITPQAGSFPDYAQCQGLQKLLWQER